MRDLILKFAMMAACAAFLFACADEEARAAEYLVNDPPYEGSVEHVGVYVARAPRSRFFYDKRSLVKTYIFKDHAGEMPEALVDFAEPKSYYLMVGRTEIRSTETKPPVKVLHMKPAGKPVVWNIGRLPIGTYMLRIIGAVPAKDQVKPPKHLVISLKVNDCPDGSQSGYILRGRGVDSFYCVQEFGIHVDDDRALVAEVQLLGDSETSLYCYNLELHDILAGCAKVAAKKNPSIFTARERDLARKSFASTDEGKKMLDTIKKEARQLSPQERAKRDDNIWYSVPGRNVMFHENYQAARGEGKAIKADDLWSTADNTKAWMFNRIYGGIYGSGWDLRFALVHDEWMHCARPTSKADAFYSLDDYLGHKPLADTGDRGWGVRQADKLVCPLARVTRDGWEVAARRLSVGNTDRYHLGGDEQYARDVAMLLCRFAYEMPIFSPRHTTGYVTHPADVPWLSDRFYQWNMVHENFASTYDRLFTFIKDNRELAAAVGRHIKWVKTPEDVIKLLDTNLVQYMAKNVLQQRLEYDNGTADILLNLTLVQGDAQVTEPWLDHMWNTGVYFYPIGLQPLPHSLSVNTTRDGSSEIGSHFYTSDGGPALGAAKLIDLYMRQGGLAKYDLRDFNRYPEAIAGCYWPLEGPAAGLNYLGIGDVGGPSVAYGYPCYPDVNAAEGWRWTKDPKFAWLLANVKGRSCETDEEWAAIAKAAEGIPDPIMNKRSRILSDWSGILETGVGNPDFRFHSAAAVRVGWGYGHSHNDALDLRVWAHGLSLLGDFGQRGGYGKPTHADTMCHNVVQIDEDQYWGHSWVSTIADMPGVRYLEARAVPPKPGVLKRQTALMDVDAGRPSAKAKPWLDPDVVTPNVYVFDVFRAKGGSTHTFAFHGCVDDLSFEISIPPAERKLYPRDATPERAQLEQADPEAKYLSDFRWTRTDYTDEEGYAVSYMGNEFRPNDADWAATCKEDILQATWKLARKAEERMVRGRDSAKGVGGAITAPMKFTRLHLFDTAGLRVLHGIVINKPRTDNINPDHKHYAGRCIYVRKPGGESVFVSLVEPYAGESFIKERRLLRVEPAGEGIDRPVAVEVKVALRKEGQPAGERTDILYADNSGKECTIAAHAFTVQADFAAVQKSGNEITQVSLTNGKRFKAGELEIAPERASYRAKITKVDYRTREVTLDQKVPAEVFAGAFVEIGDNLRSTSYDVAEVTEKGGTSVLKLRKSLELKRTRVTGLKSSGGRTVVAVPMTLIAENGIWAANADYSKVWRVEGTWDAQQMTLLGPASVDDFKADGGTIVTLEIGAGQEVVLASKVAVTKGADGNYGLEANVPVRVNLLGKGWQEHALKKM